MGENGHIDPNTLQAPGGKGTVTFRAFATWADEKRISRFARELAAGGLDEEDRGWAFRIERSLLMIESWTLTDDAGAPLPLESATLETGLPRLVANWIDNEAQRRFDGREAAKEGPFDTRSQPPSTATR